MLDYSNTDEPDDTLARAIAEADDTIPPGLTKLLTEPTVFDSEPDNYTTADYAAECGCAWDEVSDDD
jgi:hypothetical protein